MFVNKRMRDQFILSNKANGTLINGSAFAPRLTRLAEGESRIKFGSGYVIPMFYLRRAGEALNFDQAIEPENVNEELPVSESELEFYLCIKVKPLSNEILEVKFKSNKEIQEDEEDESYDKFLNIRFPIVKLENLNGSFQIVKIYLDRDIIWDKKPVEIPLRTQLVAEGTCLTAFGFLYVDNGYYYLSSDGSDLKTEDISGKFFGVKVTGEGNNRRFTLNEVIWGSFSLEEVRTETSFTASNAEIDALEPDEEMPLQPVSTVFPIAYIKDGVAIQMALGNLRAIWSSIVAPIGTTSYKLVISES